MQAAYNPYNPRHAEIKEVEKYVRQEMADFDITKRHFTFEEKHRLILFIDQCRTEIAPALVLHVLYETRGAEVRQSRLMKWLSKLGEWRKYFKEHKLNFDPKRTYHVSEKRLDYYKRKTKVNKELLREAILAIGSSAPRKGYKAMYDYYLELERVNKPDFSMAFPRVYTIIREMIEGDIELSGFFLTSQAHSAHIRQMQLRDFSEEE
ncbi:hypothetical protein [Helicobacter suis]|uniref:hypothetical protein n=1 Tax=Helicobacter suis TaxID=104628 RepID=UPI001596DB42|nr:hypothetical protein [Helicobacter suis]BCD49196.1 hypothetical protein NHP194004_06430 [Helicobacter suis]